jgi:hypothetical protein
MKTKIIFFLLLIPCIGLCQQNQPTYYLDSVKIDIEKVAISPQSMTKLDFGHNSPGGEVYITVKKDIKFLTLSDIAKSYLKIEDSDNVLFIIEDKVINDKKAIRIDSAMIKKVIKLNLSDVDYIKREFNKMIIVKIFSNVSGPPTNKDTTWVRGKATE